MNKPKSRRSSKKKGYYATMFEKVTRKKNDKRIKRAKSIAEAKANPKPKREGLSALKRKTRRAIKFSNQ